MKISTCQPLWDAAKVILKEKFMPHMLTLEERLKFNRKSRSNENKN